MSIGNPLGQSARVGGVLMGDQIHFVGAILLEIAANRRFRWQTGLDPC
jgi:hypothetical protein